MGVVYLENLRNEIQGVYKKYENKNPSIKDIDNILTALANARVKICTGQ